MYTFICVYKCIYVYTYIHIHIYMYNYVYICMCIYMCIHMCMYINEYPVYIYIYIKDYICGQHVHLRWGRSDESVRVWSMLSCRAVALVTSLQSVWHDGIVGARGLASDSRSSASGGTDLAVKTKSIGNLESSVLFLGCFRATPFPTWPKHA